MHVCRVRLSIASRARSFLTGLPVSSPAVSYNGGGYDWLQGQQLLDSVGSSTPTSRFGPACTDSATVQHAPIDLNTQQGRPNAVVSNSNLPPITFNYPPVSDYALEMNGARFLPPTCHLSQHVSCETPALSVMERVETRPRRTRRGECSRTQSDVAVVLRRQG